MKQARGWAARVDRRSKEKEQYGELLEITSGMAASIRNACWRTGDGQNNLHGPTPNMNYQLGRFQYFLERTKLNAA